MADTELRPDATDLRGQWIKPDGEVVGDTTCERVKELIRSGILKQVAGGGWETLCRDPRDGRLWELTFPLGELRGGGPRRLAGISEAAARAKYQIPRSSRAVRREG